MILKNTPQLFYTEDELLYKFERSLEDSIYEQLPIRLLFQTMPPVSVTVAPNTYKEDGISAIVINYVPIEYISNDGIKSLIYIIEGNEHILENLIEENDVSDSSI